MPPSFGSGAAAFIPAIPPAPLVAEAGALAGGLLPTEGFSFLLEGVSNKTAITITTTTTPATIDKMTPTPMLPDVVAVAGVGDGVGDDTGDGCGAAVGAGVGALVGDGVGCRAGVGPGVGAGVLEVGEGMGEGVGCRVGAGVGAAVSAGVGASGGSNIPPSELLLLGAVYVPLALVRGSVLASAKAVT